MVQKMANKRKQVQSTATGISAKELKFWLKGILEFQSKDWLPNAEQWKNIRDKIFSLEDVERMTERYDVPMPSVRQPQAYPNGGSSGLTDPTFPVAVAATSLEEGGISTDVPTASLPQYDENGFLRVPDIGIPSGGKVHKLPANGFA